MKKVNIALVMLGLIIILFAVFCRNNRKNT